MQIRTLLIDPSMSNWGLVRAILDLETLKFIITDMRLVTTKGADKQTRKVVRRNSDDIRRAEEITRAFHQMASGCTIGFVEVPVGSQSSRAMASYGMSVGILGGSPIKLIQVMPTETKMAAVGTKTASKDEMIDWAVERYPDAAWLRHNGKHTAANEHLADAIAAGHAGVQTDQFQQLRAVWLSASIGQTVAAQILPAA